MCTQTCAVSERNACEAATKTRSSNSGIEVMPRNRRPALPIHGNDGTLYLLQHLLHIERLRKKDNTDGALGRRSFGTLAAPATLHPVVVDSETPQIYMVLNHSLYI